MSAPVSEVVEHLSRHEGGALGCSPVVLQVHEVGDVMTGATVDQFIGRLRRFQAENEADGPVRITLPSGQYALDHVLGWDTSTGAVAIASTLMQDEVTS